MIKKLERKDYEKVIRLVKTRNELSVFSVIEGKIPGEIYVNSIDAPTAALIKTCECNFVAGTPDDNEFNKFIGEQLDFWDTVTPDSEVWYKWIPKIHPDKYIKEYTRRHYILENSNQVNVDAAIPEGYILEQVIPGKLRTCGYENADEVLEWMENWGDDITFQKYGAGTYLRCGNTIVSWSLSDCASKESIAIGIHTDENYRKKGLAKIVVRETIRQCFQKGYQRIEWLCVDCNKGSIALATGFGFRLNNTYVSYAPYAPVENLADLSEEQWEQWAEYFEQGAKEETRLFQECIYTYVKANNPQKVKKLMHQCENNNLTEVEISRFVMYLHTIGMASRF